MKRTTRNRLLGPLAASALAFSGTAVHAGPIGTVEFDFGSDPFAGGSDIVEVIFNDGPGGNSRTARVAAGTFGATATDLDSTDGFDASTLFRSQNDVLLYCVDLLDNLLKAPTSYNVYDVASDEVIGDSNPGAPRRDFARMLDFLGAVNHVMTAQGLGSSGNTNWLEPGDMGWLAGAIQVGIWESLYEENLENVGLNVNDGWFRVYKVGDGNRKLEQDGYDFLYAAFGAMEETTDLSANLVKRFVPRDSQGNDTYGQELIGDPVAVPAPASLPLVLGGLWLLSRRRRGR